MEKPTVMTCREVQERLSAWLDGELTAAVGAALETHLSQCGVCRREWREFTALDAALERLAAPVPPELAEKVAARLRRPARRPWLQTAALAACLVLGLTLGGVMAKGFYGTAATDAGAEMAGLEVFHDFPQGSLGAVVASYQPEAGNGDLP